ncbi:hypothetical protein FRX31_029179 [Thalictrum thalictroides]|uniref:CLAVATA3/ESR (CLE)-related protein n=1 Tax=Thalictrum thalictroides TaxID=46969 RepID=A0A7J6V8D9_THATH|nr:hypothetical protein FRX31_029179 [Thalictrum thalictroides]
MPSSKSFVQLSQSASSAPPTLLFLMHEYQVMKIQELPLSLTFLLAILTVSQFTCQSCSYRTVKEKPDQRLRNELLSRDSWSSSGVPFAADYSKEKKDRIYGVSNKLVPGGPNPLHN